MDDAGDSQILGRPFRDDPDPVRLRDTVED
jgi:hypothetical protein